MTTRVLVVEDERLVAKDLEMQLNRIGYTVVGIAPDGATAVDLASALSPDIVMMDIRLKGDLDGVDTAQILRDRFDIPAIYLTAFSDGPTLERAKVTRPLGYIVKPFAVNDLRVALAVAMHNHALDVELRQRERWFSTTLNAIGDAVIATDPAGVITFVNAAAEKVTGVAAADLMGIGIERSFRLSDERTGDPIDNPVITALHERRIVQLPAGSLLDTADGLLPIDDSVAPIIDADGELLGSVVVFRDVAKGRRMLQQAAMADRLSSLGALAAGVAHEINNPLTIVVADAESIEWTLAQVASTSELDDRAAVVQELRDQSREISDAAERIRRIVADMGTFSGPQAPMAPVDLRETVRLAIRMTKGEVQRRARVVVQLNDVPPVLANEVKLGQVCINLLLNAARSLTTADLDANEICVTTDTDDLGRAVITVSDNGCGIEARHLTRIFDPFFTTKAVGDGSGLGLAVCHGIVAELHGVIEVNSIVGEGTTFSVAIPVGEHQTDTPNPGSSPGRQRTRRRILIIDDEPVLLRVIERLLGPDDEVVAFTDPGEALRALASDQAYDAVLCDIRMPGITGLQLFEQLQSSAPSLVPRFAFMSGGVAIGDDDQRMRASGRPLLNKPMSVADLRTMVNTLAGATGAPPAH